MALWDVKLFTVVHRILVILTVAFLLM